MATVTDVSINAATTPILAVTNPVPVTLWNPGPVAFDVPYGGAAGVADDHTLVVGKGITAPAYQRVDGIDATATGVIQVLRGVTPGG